MRFCINGRQPYSILSMADEIKFNYSDKDKIFDLIDDYSTKTIILDVPGDEEDWNTWQLYTERFTEFYIALHNLNRADEFNNAGIKWYWPYPITSYYELKMIIACGPAYVLLGPPLSFDLDNVSKYLVSDITIPIRMVVNVAHPSYLPMNGLHGVCGQWVRPEDARTYETKVRCFEFGNVTLEQEAVLFKIYKENQEWPGNLNLIIQRLNWNVDNRAIPEDLAQSRMTCGQRCLSKGNCHLCVSAFTFADKIQEKSSQSAKKADIDNN